MTTDTEFDLAEDEGPEGILSFIAGVGIGVMLGAPHPGRVTREEVAKAVERLRRCVRRAPLEDDWES